MSNSTNQQKRGMRLLGQEELEEVLGGIIWPWKCGFVKQVAMVGDDQYCYSWGSGSYCSTDPMAVETHRNNNAACK